MINNVHGLSSAGDHVKFNFPMASSVTLLAMGMIRYKAGYEKAGEWDNALSCVKWPLDYLVKCHARPNELYMQVSDYSNNILFNCPFLPFNIYTGEGAATKYKLYHL